MTRAAPFAFIAGTLVLAGLIAYAGAGAVGQALTALGWDGLALICLLHLPVLALLGLAWWSIGRDMAGASPWKFMWARFIRESAAEVLPFSQLGGFVIGIRSLTLAGLGTLPTAVSMLLDLVIELAAKLPYLMAGLLLLFVSAPGSGLIRPVAAAITVAGLGIAAIVIFRARIKAGLERAAIALAGRWPALGLGPAIEIRPAFDRLMTHDSRILFGFGVHLLCWALGAVETWVVLHLIGIPASLLEAVVIDSLVTGFRTFGFIVPGALGVQEGGYVLVCALFGISPAVALALSLARRARELALGVPGLGAWQAAEGRRAIVAPDRSGG